MATYDDYLHEVNHGGSTSLPNSFYRGDKLAGMGVGTQYTANVGPQDSGSMGSMTGYSASAPAGASAYGAAAYQGGSAGASGAQGGTTNTAAGAKPNSLQNQINNIYNAALEQEKARIDAAYAGLTPDYDLARDRLHQQYLDDLNRTDVEAQKAQLNWNEAKTALGLSSGTMGQALLARQNQTQDAMSDLRAAELAAQAKLQADYEKQKQQYAAELREAIAKNDYEKAKALYDLALNGKLGSGSGSSGGSGSNGRVYGRVGPQPAEAGVGGGSSGSSGSRGRSSGGSSKGGDNDNGNTETTDPTAYYQGLLKTAEQVAQTQGDKMAGGNATYDDYAANIQEMYKSGRLTETQYNQLLKELATMR